VIEYRAFRNDDPPHLVRIWNEAFPGRAAYLLRSSAPLEAWVFSKPYFDQRGLIIASDDGFPVGFTHAGFGPNADESALDPSRGVTCILAVVPSHRKHGVGAGLLQHSEEYLISHGARELFAGPMRPLNPFYFGLYGGSDSPGFLTADIEAGPFFERAGYAVHRTCHVFHRKLDQPAPIIDSRFTGLRRRFDAQVLPRTKMGTWWEECLLGQLEPIELRLEERKTSELAARATFWEMDGFSWRWNYPAAGIIDVFVRPDLRRQGLGKYLLSQLLRHLQEQYFGLAEVQAIEDNTSAIALFQSLGFEQVDTGRQYRKDVPAQGG
jgi:ribosomal protein S18 acetylase RimI-like enzyme